jgi:redox-sensitive bicupin YhaK (pirin superfamily)
MSFFPGQDPEPDDAGTCDAVELLIVPRTSDIGGLEVRRALPSAKRRLVGPFIFFDRMGPALLRAGQALDVRPHPHIGLSTVTYLFDGSIRHRDSLGTAMVVEPGDVNLMTAGRGIVHSERSPEEMRGEPLSLSGIQTWLALPDALEETDPGFEHTRREALPVIAEAGFQARLVMGEFHGARSPVRLDHETVYVDVRLAPGGCVPLPPSVEERAIYVLDGTIEIAGDRFEADRLLVLRPGDEIVVTSPDSAHIVFLGGAPLGSKRHIWWNFVSSSKERIEQAKEEWKSRRFAIVPGDEEEFVPLPA